MCPIGVCGGGLLLHINGKKEQEQRVTDTSGFPLYAPTDVNLSNQLASSSVFHRPLPKGPIQQRRGLEIAIYGIW